MKKFSKVGTLCAWPISNWLFGFTFPARVGELALLPEVGPKAFKAYPGVTYNPKFGHGVWTAPVEALDHVCEWAELFGLAIDISKIPGNFGDTEERFVFNEKLHSYQQDSVLDALTFGAHYFAYDTGLGKTAGAIDVLRRSRIENALIVCPAVARKTWARELSTWWADCPLDIAYIESGKCKIPATGIVVISWALLTSRIKELDRLWDAVVLDEAHMACNWRTGRTKAARALRKKNENAVWLELSGTPIGNDVEDLWQQLDLLFPGRFGSFSRFCERYCAKKPNAFRKRGYDCIGIREKTAEELEHRLTYVASRVTKNQVAHLLPPITTQRVEVDDLGGVTGRVSEKKYLRWLDQTSNIKVRSAVEWIQNAQATGVKHVAVATHLRATATQIAGAFPDGVVIDGSVSADTRESLIAKARRGETSVVCCTMASVGVAINALAAYSNALFVELAYWPVEVLQAIGRFHRLNSLEPVFVSFLMSSSGPDQRVAFVLERKIKGITRAFAPGTAEDAVLQGVASSVDWQAQLLAGLEELENIWEDDCDGYLKEEGVL